jgi:hypothetical protein
MKKTNPRSGLSICLVNGSAHFDGIFENVQVSVKTCKVHDGVTFLTVGGLVDPLDKSIFCDSL